MQTPRISLLGAAAVFGCLVLLALILIPAIARSRAVSCRSACGANLSGLYKSMYTYATGCSDRFPAVDRPDEAGSAIGFGDRRDGANPDLKSNVTASLWIMVKDGSSQAKQMICPTSDDEPDGLADTDRKHA
ncbi:MAG: hypothetical protein R3236_05410 [Phycisphaeraceae bacterium]|nr:hypothetical protein [Phycisphaeraceae bacterium]